MERLTFAATLMRGVIAGAVGGLVAALVQLALVERPLRAALAIEEARPHQPGAAHHEDMFDRTTQVIGGMLATLVVSIAIGIVFAIVYARLRHRLPGRGDFERALVLAAAGFLAVSLVPGITYPANPPGVGDPNTVTERTLAWATLILAGIVLVGLLAQLATILNRRGWDHAVRLTVTGAVGVLAFGAMVALWPDNPDAIPADIPADVLWRFRMLSLLELATLWTVLGAAFGLLLHRHSRREQPVTG